MQTSVFHLGKVIILIGTECLFETNQLLDVFQLLAVVRGAGVSLCVSRITGRELEEKPQPGRRNGFLPCGRNRDIFWEDIKYTTWQKCISILDRFLRKEGRKEALWRDSSVYLLLLLYNFFHEVWRRRKAFCIHRDLLNETRGPTIPSELYHF